MTLVVLVIDNLNQTKTFNKQLKLNFFSEYTKRYQDIALNLPENINDDDFSYKNMLDEERSHVLRYMRVYFDLCSEEFYLYSNNCLDENVWENWEEGISCTMNKKAYKEAWKIINASHFYNGDFEKWVESKMHL
ncbi:hypothetical protein LJC43_04605 [Parabacteroides sp. OttesenSCG-928-G21]|nr:hypothetical protein [Parabacteroides sp. OttesenSCG-928-G21]